MTGEIIVTRERRQGLLFRLLANAAAVYVAGAVLSGVHVSGVVGALIAALILTIVNAIVRPVLVFMTLPLTLMTLGLFLLVVNAMSLGLAAWLAGGAFDISGFGSAVAAWILIWAVNWVISLIFRRERVEVR